MSVTYGELAEALVDLDIARDNARADMKGLLLAAAETANTLDRLEAEVNNIYALCSRLGEKEK